MDVPEAQNAMPYCVMVRLASEGRGCRSRLEHHKCDGGTTALALEPSTSRIESGSEYFFIQSLLLARRRAQAPQPDTQPAP